MVCWNSGKNITTITNNWVKKQIETKTNRKTNINKKKLRNNKLKNIIFIIRQIKIWRIKGVNKKNIRIIRRIFKRNIIIHIIKCEWRNSWIFIGQKNRDRHMFERK